MNTLIIDRDYSFLENKKVLFLFTPGVDTFLTNWFLHKFFHINNTHQLFPDDALYVKPVVINSLKKIYVDINSRYSKIEMKELGRMYNDITYITDVLNLEKYEDSDGYIPNRNLSIITAANQQFPEYDVILMSGFKDDRVCDNNKHFCKLMSDVLSKSSQKEITVTSLFYDYEKSELVELYNRICEEDIEIRTLLTNTYSCYNYQYIESFKYIYGYENEKLYKSNNRNTISGCLKCKACFRKLCALTAENVYIEGDFDPSTYELLTPDFIDMYPNRAKTITNYVRFLNEIKRKKE